jgi:flagellar motility protein MotE (MotC chaperone)
MDPDDIAKICTKLPDPVVIQTLSALDQKKAGKVLAAMDTARAAKITETMLATPPTPPGATPAVSVP